MDAVETITSDVNRCANDPTKICKANGFFGLNSIVYLIICAFLVGGSFFVTKARIDYIERDQDAIHDKVQTLNRDYQSTREAFTRLDERLAGLQRELAEIKQLLQRAIDRPNTKL